MDLWTPIVAEPKQHPNFRRLIENPLDEPERKVITGWASDFLDRDNKFVHEFQTTFNSCFWELYLHACFRDLGLAIDFTHQAPDFLLQTKAQSIVAEATIAQHAEGYVAEWERDIDDIHNVDDYELLRSSSLRISNSISSKLKKYRTQYADLPHVQSKPFVLCVACYDQPFFFLQNDIAMRRVLFGMDQPLWFIHPTTGKRVIVGESLTPREVKDTGATVEFGIFATSSCPEISAVVFSNTATFGKARALACSQQEVVFRAVRYDAHNTEPLQIAARRPDYRESLLDGLHVFLNPFATQQLDISSFDRPEIAVHSLDPTGAYNCKVAHGHLFQRQCFSFRPEGATASPAVDQPEPKKSPHARRPWPEAQMVSVGGTTGTFTDHHLAHYRGWTIVVVRDLVDGNWGWQAHTGLARNVAEYMKLCAGDDGTPAMCDAWFSSKEASFEDAKTLIGRMTL